MNIEKILDLHEKWINTNGVEGERANLKGADLIGANLNGANLKGADLREADLEGAYLEGAYLEGAYLIGADLRGADLRRAYLREANLREADLKGADLEGAYLEGAYLEGADLREADLEGADLRGADLEGADLEGTDLRETNLEEADLRGADLRGADLEGAREDLCSITIPLQEKPTKAIDPKQSQGSKKVGFKNVPYSAIINATYAADDGAAKYGPHNWIDIEDGTMSLTTYLDAIQRHLLLLRAGQDVTSDSGIHHLQSIVGGANVALDAMMHNKINDDRVKLPDEAIETLEKHLMRGK